MLTSTETIIIDTINTTTKTISIQKQTVIKNNDVVIATGEPIRRAFVPGEIDEVKVFTGWNDETPEIIYLNSIWTEEVIDAYRNNLHEDTIQEMIVDEIQ